MPRGHDIWRPPDPRRRDGRQRRPFPADVLASMGSYGPPDWGEYRGDLGALWLYDWPTGTVDRQEFANGPIRTIRVTESPPYPAGGPCLTSITVRLGKSLGDGGRRHTERGSLRSVAASARPGRPQH